ncbi:MAG: nucleotidyltransferase domain-containing protein [Anaerolineales bacterium]
MISLTKNESQALHKLITQLTHNYAQRVQQVVLFGSKARGTSAPDSDIDLLIVLNKDDWRLRRRILTFAADISLEFDVLLNPFVKGSERWRAMQGFTLHRNVQRDGLRLDIQKGTLTFEPENRKLSLK